MLKTKLYPFQEEGVNRIEELNGRVLLADQMGLGKSIQSITYLDRHPELRPVIIVCDATIKMKWQRELKQHAGMKSEIISGNHAPQKCPVFEEDIIIINYDILQRKHRRGRKPSGKSWIDHLQKIKPKVIIIDEAQRIKNPDTIISKTVQKLCKNVPHVLILTGTPIENRPADIFPTLKILRKDLFGSAFRFYEEFCDLKKTIWGWEWKGASNLKKLNKLLLKNVMIRRKKEDVLDQLPKKTQIVVPMEITGWKEYVDQVKGFLNWLRDPDKDESLTKLNLLNSLKHEVAKKKLSLCLQWLGNWLTVRKGKIIVFAVHLDIIKKIHQRFPDRSVVITGSKNSTDRNQAIRDFQKNPKVDILIGQLIAAGTGWDGTEASAVAFFELGWNPAKHDQAEARGSRIGSKYPLSCYYLIGHDTIEMDILRIWKRKQKIINQAIDGHDNKVGDFSVHDQVIASLRKRVR